MGLPFIFQEHKYWIEFLALFLFIVGGYVMALMRRFRWNWDGIFRIHHGRWSLSCMFALLLYAVCVLIARDTIFLWPRQRPITQIIRLFIWQDISLSALARDVVYQPEKDGTRTRTISRFRLAKLEIDRLLAHAEGNHVFFGVFGDEAYPVVPLELVTKKTLGIFRAEIGRISEKTVARGQHGTNIGKVLSATAENIPPEFSEGREVCVPHVIVILTDGEPVGDEGRLARDLEDGIEKLRRVSCVFIHIVGVGNPDKTSRIPVLDQFGRPNGEYEVDDKGIIPTKPNFRFLNEIAETLGGEFLEGRTGSELAASLQEVLTKEKRIIGYKDIVDQIPLVWYLSWLVLALLLLLNPFRNPLE